MHKWEAFDGRMQYRSRICPITICSFQLIFCIMQGVAKFRLIVKRTPNFDLCEQGLKMVSHVQYLADCLHNWQQNCKMPLLLIYALILRDWEHAPHNFNILLTFNCNMSLLFDYIKVNIGPCLRGQPHSLILITVFTIKPWFEGHWGIEILDPSAQLCDHCALNWQPFKCHVMF